MVRFFEPRIPAPDGHAIAGLVGPAGEGRLKSADLTSPTSAGYGQTYWEAEALKTQDQVRTIHLTQVGAFFGFKGQLQLAQQYLDEGLRLSPHPETYFNRGRIAELQGDLAGAETYYQAALTAHPHYCKVLYNLGSSIKKPSNISCKPS